MAAKLGTGSLPVIRARALWRPSGKKVLIAGLVMLAITLAGFFAFTATHAMYRWMQPVDLAVYRLGGEIAAGNAPGYDRLASPLYGWPGYGLKFTYTPFAALIFTVLTLASWSVLTKISIGVNIAALAATIWVTLGGLGYRPGKIRIGATLFLTGVLFWIEPVLRTLYLGQVELVLLALIMWDLCQSDRRRWKGAGVGIAAGIKLVPLIFIPYLLLTRRFRQAGVAAGMFVITVLVGFLVLPSDSRDWWMHGLFFKGSRTGFVGWEGNQSLQGLITRLAGSIAAGQPIWIAAAAVAVVLGLTAAVLMDRAGHSVVAVLTCALTGLLVSPISWDHHWVWMAPVITVLAVYGVRARAVLRWTYLVAAALLAGLFGAWPGFLWGEPVDLGGFSMGFIWAPPNTPPGTFAQLGDRSWYAEYHWHGLQLLTGNLFVLTGLALLVTVVVVVGVMGVRARIRGPWPPPFKPGLAQAPAGTAVGSGGAH